jgi:hypothetical protein
MTDDPVARIDEVLHDYTVSGDAMRSRPVVAGTPPSHDPVVATGGLIWIAPAGTHPGGGGWQRLDGITGCEFTINPSTIDPAAWTQPAATWPELLEAMERMEEERARCAAALLQMIDRIVMRLAERWGVADVFRHAPEADDCGDPAPPPVRPSPPLPRRDRRPAWQTPYGPRRWR